MKSISLAVMLVASVAQAAGKPRAAVLDFAANGVDPSTATTLAELVATELSKTGKYDTLSRQDVVSLLGLERMKQLSGCGSAACLDAASEAGQMLDVRYLVAGSVGRLGSTFVVTAQIVDAPQARVANRAIERAATVDGLASVARKVSAALVEEPATLELSGQVAGGHVFLDDRRIADLPLTAIALAEGGTHRLRAEAPDCLPFETDVELVRGRTARIRLDLQRIDTLRESSASRTKWAIGAGVAGVALAGAGAYLFLGAQDARADYLAADATQVTQAQLDSLADRAKWRYFGADALGVLALGAFGTAAWLALTDPDGDRLREAGQVAWAPSLSVKSFGVAARF